MKISKKMKTEFKILFTILLLSSSFLLAQQSRLDALGGLSYSIVDIDSQIDPYLLGGNPAWLINSQINKRLEIVPFFTNSRGSYHRYYESSNVNKVNTSFTGIKPLGSAGTFRGFAAYNYEFKKDRNKILTLTPYSGDAFFFTDTTSGDYRYRGPTFEFLHSFEIFDDFYFGASVNYKILDGLKKVYTFAETLYRDVTGNIGIAYRLSNDVSVGFNYKIFDTQERIIATDVNNRTVQTFLYRGETYKIELRGSSQDFKIKRLGNEFAFQAQIIPFDNLTIGLDAKYQLISSSSLFKVTSIINTEDGYTSYDNIRIALQAKWLKSDIITLGFTGGYINNNSWSKKSKLNLTIWDLSVNDIFAGAGFTYLSKNKKILVGTEYELHSISADSLKYIDNMFTKISALNHILRIGFEASLSEIFIVRIGYNFIYKEHDFIYGGNNVTTHFLTLGGKIKVSDSMEIEPRLEYATTSLSESTLYKNNFGIYTTLRFYKF